MPASTNRPLFLFFVCFSVVAVACLCECGVSMVKVFLFVVVIVLCSFFLCVL